MNRFSIHDDPEMKLSDTLHVDASGDRGVVESVQDVTEIVETNKAFMADSDKQTRYGEMPRVASIPMNVYMDLQRRGIVQDKKAFKAWLNDPDNLFFRTRPGVV